MNLDQAEPRHDAQIAHLPEPPSLRTYRARQAPRLPAAPRTLAETGLDEAFVAALLLKSMLAHGRSSLTEIVARHGLPPAVLDEVLTFLACERLIEVTHRGLSDIDLTLRLTELGRALALEEKARNSYCGPAPVTHEAYVASVTAHSVRHVTIARADAHAAFDGIVVEPAMLDAAAASLNAGRPLLIYGPAAAARPISPSASARCCAATCRFRTRSTHRAKSSRFTIRSCTSTRRAPPTARTATAAGACAAGRSCCRAAS